MYRHISRYIPGADPRGVRVDGVFIDISEEGVQHLAVTIAKCYIPTDHNVDRYNGLFLWACASRYMFIVI